MKMNIGFIGLGKMGIPMAKNLIMARHKLNVYDKNSTLIDPLIKLGANKQNSIEDVGKHSDCIFIMVYPPDAAFNIIFEQGLLEGIKSKKNNKQKIQRTIIVDGGNADYIKSKEIGEMLDKEAISYIDVGFSGGPSEAENKNLAAFVGGDSNALPQIHPLLSALCNNNKINYLGEVGSGHFVKVIAHNTTEYVIMGIIGEIASLSNEVGDHKKIMTAVNSGLAETKLGSLYLKLTNEDIESTGCKIGFTQNAAELALREAKRYKIGMPLVTIIYYLRKISEELYDTDSISVTTRNNLMQDIFTQLDVLEQEQKNTGTVRSMAIQAQLRKTFGGHSIYGRKVPDG